MLFRFRDNFLAAASQQQVSAAVADLRRTEDAEDLQMLGDSGVLRLRSRSKNAAALIRALSARGDILYAEPNFIVRASAAPVNDHRFPELWGLHNTGQGVIPGIPGSDIDAVKAWQMTTGTIGNVVAVVDTGVDYKHPDLAANMWRAPAAFTVTVAGKSITCAAGTFGYNAITDTCDPMDDQDHGTHVAGTIGGVGNNGIGVIGVSPVTRIMGLKFLDSGGYGTTANAIKAIEFAIQVKAKFAATRGANVRVLNNSWGGDGFSQALADTIQRTNQADMLFVAAAGNDMMDNDIKPTYPASYKLPNVMTIAASDSSDLRAWFSNWGLTSVHVAAPGERILSTIRGANYAYFSGTSMATPHVAGAAALVLSNCPMDTISLKGLLLRTAERLPHFQGLTITGARLNVAAALNGCKAPYYSLAIAPAEATITPGGTNRYTVTITPFNGFTGPVTMSTSGLPLGATGTFQPAVVNVTGSAQTTILTVATTLNVIPGLHAFTVAGISGEHHRTAWASARIPGYRIMDVGSLPAPAGSREVEPRDISAIGQIVGGSATAPPGSFSTFTHAFLWTTGTMRDLGTLGGPISEAYGVSRNGHVVGSSASSLVGYDHAFLWTNGRMQDLGTLPGHVESFAFGVNDSGHVVGYSSNGSLSERAFLRTTGPLVNLGTLGGSRSRALAINNLGHIVGYSERSNYVDHAFIYNNGSMKDLGTLGRNPNGSSRAVAINDKAQIAGSSTVGQDLFTVHAFLWTQGTMTDIGGLTGLPYSYAKDINNAGHVVGFLAPVDETIAGEEKRAFLYRDGKLLNLNDAIPADTGWVLLQANAINDNGVIVGTGKFNNEIRGFRLVPLR